MNKIIKLITICAIASTIFISCAKKPLTLDKETSMKTLLKASDKDITDLVVKEATEKANLDAKDVNVEYILRDEKSQAIAVKIKINQEQ